MSLTPKRERFCQEVASGKSQAEAYRAAFNAENMKDETVHQAASRLMANSNVSARVEELREPVAKKAQITLESHLEDLQRLRNMAVKANQMSAAISAEVARGKAAGVHIEKSEQLVTVRKLEPIADDEFLG
jgi:phage terminase small subunit